ncbi:hypothetical protein K1T71_001481 [Dendrolimus kikuchii]|uniref:Uncharacterized protein n=1 Tax=Dendrolimus kikuchii TaxID=765133 RepID=A0ACC1DI87_9NEOP|nr:hypothetical protein K1T71_001481 [Dendrolimus kikuchii]
MDMSEVKSFNAELSGLYDNKPPISKAKMSAITRGAIKAIKFYKHVVHSVEKFIQKCKPEYKVPGLYVIDSIVRQSRHQFGQDKDVFAPRFAKNMQQTFANLFRCPPEDKRNIIRVLNLWQKNNVFSPQVIQPLLDMADPNHPLHQEIQQQQNSTANGSSLNVSHNASDSKLSPGPPQQHTPRVSTPMGDQFQDQPSSQPAKFNRKLLNDFEYESEDEAIASESTPTHTYSHSAHSMSHSGHTSHTGHSSHGPHGGHGTNTTHQPQHAQQNPTDALGSILTNPEIMRQLQSLQAQMQMMTGMQIPNLMPMMSDMQLQQNQNPNLPFMNSQMEQQKQNEPKDDMANESDIEFVETGPQVIEIPDVNDSSPSPKSRRHRSRSKSPKRRRRSRSRSRSPRRRRDREKERDREKDREKTYKEREADREKQKEREKKGLPPIKKENLSVCSTTLWVGHLSKLATPEELSDLFGGVGGVVSIDVVAPRGCAFVVMERRRDAYKAKNKLNKHKLHSKEITVAWAPGKGVKGREWKDYWEAELGVSYLPWGALQARWALGALSLDALEDGGAVDEDTLPPWLPPRMIPKTMMENMSMLGGMPPGSGPGMLPPNLPPLSAGPPPGGLPPGALPPGNLPPGALPPGNLPPGPLPGNMPPGGLQGALSLAGSLPPAPNMTMSVPRMPPPGMPGGMPPGMGPGLPPGMRPSLPTGVPGPLLRFPPGMPPQSLPQPGEFLSSSMGGLVGGVGLPMPHPHAHAPHPAHAHPAHAQLAHPNVNTPPPTQTSEMTQSDDAMDLDTEENHSENTNGGESNTDTSKAPPNMLSDQFQALLSKPPPNFNSSEPPPNFNSSEPPPFSGQEEKPDEDRKGDRDRDRRDRDRDRDRRERDRDRRDRGDRERRERGDRGDRDRGREDRRDRERSREKSPRNPNNPNTESNEKSLQERLWEMANGKPNASEEEKEFPDREEERENNMEDVNREEREENQSQMIERMAMRHDGPPPTMDGDNEEPGPGPGPGDSGWTQLPPPRLPPPHMAPHFRAELRMRGPPRHPMSGPGPGPWMDGPPGPGPFGPRFNGMGPPLFNRPPFERPPFEGGPLFEGPPRPFDRPPFDGDRPPFDGPPRFDGPPEFFDRNNRRADDREQYNDRGWNGDRDRDRDWDRRGEWDDRRRERRPREHEDRFRDRNDRRRNFDDRSGQDRRGSSRDERSTGPRDERSSGPRDERSSGPRDERSSGPRDERSSGPRDERTSGPRDDRNSAPSRDERHSSSSRDDRHSTPTRDDKHATPVKEERSRRDKDRKSRWGAAEEMTKQEQEIIQEYENNQRDTNKADSNEDMDNTSERNTSHDEQTAIDDTNCKPEEIDKPIKGPEAQVEELFQEIENDQHYDESSNKSETIDQISDAMTVENKYEAPIEYEQMQKEINEPILDLYDANEAIDTSFSQPLPIENEIPPVVEKEPIVSDVSDIFGQEKETEDTSEARNVENKEGVA